MKVEKCLKHYGWVLHGAHGACAHGTKTYLPKLYMFRWAVCFKFWAAKAFVPGHPLKLEMFQKVVCFKFQVFGNMFWGAMLLRGWNKRWAIVETWHVLASICLRACVAPVSKLTLGCLKKNNNTFTTCCWKNVRAIGTRNESKKFEKCPFKIKFRLQNLWSDINVFDLSKGRNEILYEQKASFLKCWFQLFSNSAHSNG